MKTFRIDDQHSFTYPDEEEWLFKIPRSPEAIERLRTLPREKILLSGGPLDGLYKWLIPGCTECRQGPQENRRDMPRYVRTDLNVKGPVFVFVPRVLQISIDRVASSFAVFERLDCVRPFESYTDEEEALTKAKAWVAERTTLDPEIIYPRIDRMKAVLTLESVQGNPEDCRFKWSYKGRTPDGCICSFSGSGFAKTADDAMEGVEDGMRRLYPKITWMHGRDVEGVGENRGCTFGPTVQMLKTRKKNETTHAQQRRGQRHRHRAHQRGEAPACPVYQGASIRGGAGRVCCSRHSSQRARSENL